MKIRISKPLCYSAQGHKQNQEDSLFPAIGEATERNRVFLVCDGMGGHENGEVASQCVAETIGQATSLLPLCSTAEMKVAFLEALEKAYNKLDELDHSTSIKKMGTTLTFLALCTDGALVAHIGDSRVYQLRPGEGIIFQTRDHSLVNELIASGELSEEEARTFPQRNVITRAVQPHQEYKAKATFNHISDIKRGDLFFLCCDGVVEQLDNNALSRYLLNNKSLEERIVSIKKACETRNTQDNNTAYLIEVTDIMEDEEVKLIKVPKETPPVLEYETRDNGLRYWILTFALFVMVALSFVMYFCI